jgi:hypothetical protein
MKLAELQALFQSALMSGDPAVLDVIPNSPRETNATLLGVYQNAYILRLRDILRTDFDKLAIYMGDEAFDDMARRYFAARPSHHRSARWIGSALADFLNTDARCAEHPVLADLARLDGALSDAFDAEDAQVLDLAALAAIAPDDWGRLTFKPHPVTRRLTLSTNAAAIWSALATGEAPPDAIVSTVPQRLIIWRQGTLAKFRPLAAEEAMMWDEAAAGVSFGVLCEMLATYDAPDTAPLRAATYLRGWIEGCLLTAATVAA